MLNAQASIFKIGKHGGQGVCGSVLPSLEEHSTEGSMDNSTGMGWNTLRGTVHQVVLCLVYTAAISLDVAWHGA